MKKRRLLYKLFINTAAALLLSIGVFAQQVIKGTLKSPTGEPLSGATVTIKGTGKSVMADTKGVFSINAPQGSTLVISSVGYKALEITANGTELNATLETAENSLNDVVVIGYQSVRKKDLTGATGIVNIANSNKITSGSVVESIQGLVAGVTVRNGGAPGQNSTIEIRGVASFTNSDPLYVIDGMLSDANTTINSDDVASIQILKDASAAAIYGSRAANGVVIITTKKGKEGPAKMSFSAKYGVQTIPKRWDVMDASRFVATQKLQYQNSGLPYPTGLNNPKFNTNWQDEVYRTGNDQDYNLGVSGGTATSNYLISGSYYKNQGVLVGNSFDRASVRINTEARKGILTIGENMVISATNGKNPGGVNAFYEAPQMYPIIAVQDPSYATQQYNPGGWGFGTNETPTYASNYIANAALDKQTYSFGKIVANAYAELKFAKWLSYKFNAGAEVSYDSYKEIRDTGIWRYTNQPPATSINESRQRYTNFLLDHTLNFNKSFGLHSINGVVGYSYQEIKREVTSGGRIYLQTVNGQTFTTISSALGTASSDGGTPDMYRIQSLLGRVNYNYADKYLLTVSGRRDQDSRFGPDYRNANFYAAGAGWRISKENFFKVAWISDLKIRGSYGQLGINTLGSFPYQGVINSNPRAIYGTGQAPIVGQYQAVTTNPDLRWEKRNESNIGFDAQLLNNKITVSADVYKNIAKDVLVQNPLAGYSGNAGAFPFANAGSIRNSGFELSVGYRHTTGEIKWDVTVNGTTIKNKVLSVGNQGVGKTYLEPTNFIRSQIGNAMGSWFLIETNGLFQSQAEIDNYKNKAGNVIQPNAKPGDVKYVDANDDGQINNDDRQFTGSAFPSFQGGLQFNISWHQFSLNMQWVGVFGNSVYNDIRRVLDGYQLTNFRSDINPWTPTNTNTKDPRLGVQTGDPGISDNNRAESDRWLESGSYGRLRNLEIGYTFNKNILSKIGFANARLYVGAQNLLTITKYKGLDPDVVGNGILQRGFDNGNWPSSRRVSFGIQCDF